MTFWHTCCSASEWAESNTQIFRKSVSQIRNMKTKSRPRQQLTTSKKFAMSFKPNAVRPFPINKSESLLKKLPFYRHVQRINDDICRKDHNQKCRWTVEAMELLRVKTEERMQDFLQKNSSV